MLDFYFGLILGFVLGGISMFVDCNRRRKRRAATHGELKVTKDTRE